MAKKEAEQYKPGDYYLRASVKHPARRFRIGRHDLTAQCLKFNLNEAEAKELGTAGPQMWVEICDKKAFEADQKLYKNVKKGAETVPGFGQGVKEEL